MNVLTENTLIPIGLAILAIGGGAIWISRVWFITEGHTKTLERLEQRGELYMQAVERTNSELQEIKQRLVAIETIIKRER